MFQMTLSPNRGDQKRYTRTVHFEKIPGKTGLHPSGYYDDHACHVSKPLSWSQIKRQPADPELEVQWLEHVDTERAVHTAAATCKVVGCNHRHWPSTGPTRQDLIDRGFIRPR